MANRLASATSPYLLQHADNPVDWWPWNAEALAEARRRDVPILLSVGYAACHWCHVMAHESFADPETAHLMNENFVNIKVDREERPDIDAVYMAATQAMTGQGGWPMTCFLTPDGEPFHCGTYYPPQPHPGLPSFQHLLVAVAQAWRENRAELREGAANIVAQLAPGDQVAGESTMDSEALASAVAKLLSEEDTVYGGFGGAPKFPPSMVLEFLLRQHEATGAAEPLTVVRRCAEAMARGGIYDQLAGGFARYSVDAAWDVPHFEKMLYDNALLLSLYTHLARRTSDVFAARVARCTGEFLVDYLRTEEGGFAASLDADTDGVEGGTYVWTRDELYAALGSEDGQWAAELFGVDDQGNVGAAASTLRLIQEPDDDDRFARVRDKLLAVRELRPQPARDDKVVTAWNGLAIRALAEAGMALDNPQWISLAEQAASYIVDTHWPDGQLRRSSRAGAVGEARAVLEDYGCLADGLLALHQATAEPRWLNAATRLLDEALAQFAVADVPGAFYDTAADAEELIYRPADPGDNASPSGASALAGALVTAAALVAPERAEAYRMAAEHAVNRMTRLAVSVPRFAGHWLSVATAIQRGPLQIAVVGNDFTDRAPLLLVALREAPGGSVVLAGAPNAAGVPLLAGRELVDRSATAYVCRGFVCDRPVSTPDELSTQLAARSSG